MFDIIKLIFAGIFLFINLIFIIFFLYSSFSSTPPFVPSRKNTAQQMVDLIDFNKDDIVYDLGSGDGRFVIFAAKKGIKKAIGFEINPLLNLYARIKSRILGLNNTIFFTKSLWKADLSLCDKLFVYIFPSTMKKLEEKAIREMKPGSLIISNTFSFPNLKPFKQVDNIKIYKIPQNKND